MKEVIEWIKLNWFHYCWCSRCWTNTYHKRDSDLLIHSDGSMTDLCDGYICKKCGYKTYDKEIKL